MLSHYQASFDSNLKYYALNEMQFLRCLYALINIVTSFIYAIHQNMFIVSVIVDSVTVYIGNFKTEYVSSPGVVFIIEWYSRNRENENVGQKHTQIPWILHWIKLVDDSQFTDVIYLCNSSKYVHSQCHRRFRHGPKYRPQELDAPAF